MSESDPTPDRSASEGSASNKKPENLVTDVTGVSSRIRTQRAVINAAIFWESGEFDLDRPCLDP